MNEPLLDPAPDFAAPLEAWRVWRVIERDGELTLGSIIKPAIWPAGRPLVAECLHCRPLLDWVRPRHRHEAPEMRCECGIYGAGLDQIDPYLNEPLMRGEVVRVLGRVALWGQVVECERGFRASHAYPLDLFVPSEPVLEEYGGSGGVIGALDRYGVPVEMLATGRRDAPTLLAALH